MTLLIGVSSGTMGFVAFLDEGLVSSVSATFQPSLSAYAIIVFFIDQDIKWIVL
jgi:hypothetical protein